MRATSSRRSASISISQRRGGTETVNVSSENAVPKPRRRKISSTSCSVREVPSTLLIFFNVILTSFASAFLSLALATPETTWPLPSSAIICAAASSASATVALLMPRSKRIDASECRFSRREVLRMLCPLKTADSSAIVVVSGTTSESRPPIVPARATGTSPFVTTMSFAFSSRSSPSSVVIFSPSSAKRTTIFFEPNLS